MKRPALIVYIFFATLINSVWISYVKAQDIQEYDVLKTLNRTHPRLLVSSLNTFEDLKKAIPSDTFMQKCGAAILHTADSILLQPEVQYKLNNQLGGQLLEVSRTLYKRVYVLAMAYRLTLDKKYADKVWSNLYAASRFPDWNPWHFLDVAEMLNGFAIGYDWLYNVWTPDQRKILKQAIVDKGLLRAYLGYTGYESYHLVDWPNATSNWAQVCSGGIGLAALAIADEEPKLCSYLIKQIIGRLPATMRKLEPDGASEEGPGYWMFGTQYNVTLIAGLRSALNTDFGLSKLPAFSKTGTYFLAMAGTFGKPFDYADCWIDEVQAPELFWFANEYNQPLLRSYQANHSKYSPLDLLWYKTSLGTLKDLPLDNYFRRVEVATIRSGWHDPKGWFIGFKAGLNTANHGHLDIGSFVLEKNGERWAVDLQHDSYALPGYFDVNNGQRWTYYRMKAEGHNTLVLDPDHHPDQDPHASTKFTRFSSGLNKSFGIMDITSAYTGKVTSALRGIQLLNKTKVIIQDEVSADHVIKDLYWFMHTRAGIQLSPDKKTAILSLNHEKLKLEIISPLTGNFEVLSAQPLPQSENPDGQDGNQGISRLTIHLNTVENVSIAVVFKEIDDKSTTKLIPLKDW